MRDWQAWLKFVQGDLYEQLRTDTAPIQLQRKDCATLLEVELVLSWIVALNDGTGSFDPFDAWSLLTGYIPVELQDQTDQIQKLWIIRHRVRYLRTQTAWHRVLEWYFELPAAVRLFEINSATNTLQERLILHYAPHRTTAIAEALSTVVEHTETSEQWAVADQEYAFYIGSELASVRIPGALLDGISKIQVQQPSLLLPKPPRRFSPTPIVIRMADLHRAAIALEEKLPGRNWTKRFEQLQLHLIGEQLCSAEEFTIAGLFHLLGPTGAGKSTLIYLLVYHLCTQNPQFRIGLIAATVVDAIDFAADCVLMGIAAAPILGRQRGEHRYQYGMAKADILAPEILMQPYDPSHDPEAAALLDNPALSWLTGTCILSGLMGESDIPAGNEPCRDLTPAELLQQRKFEQRQRRVETHTCPFLPICPVHQANRDLVQAQVWVATPASLLFTTMPHELTGSTIRALEAVYQLCDLLIVDEADRAQVSVEDTFAPTNDLSGHPRTILDQIAITLAQRDFSRSYIDLVDGRYRELRGIAAEAERLVSWMRSLLIDHEHLREWAKRPLYNALIYSQLLEELRHLAPDTTNSSELTAALERLAIEFEQYYRGLREADLQTVESLERIVADIRLRQRNQWFGILRQWLQARLPYTLNDSESHRQLIERVGFGLVLTALDRHVNDLLRYWLNTSPELGEGLAINQNPPDEYIDLGIESPLGNLLGYQFFATNEQATTGLLRYLHCLGLGRYLLLGFPILYHSLTGEYGPHVLLTSATSWAPGSPQFNIGIRPHAILVPPTDLQNAIENSQFRFVAVPDIQGNKIRVSGRTGEYRYDSLLQLTRYLAFGSGAAESPLEKELAYWRSQGKSRGILLLTGSYPEAEAVAKLLHHSNQWRDRVACLQSDRAPESEDWYLRRGQTEQFPKRNQDILVAPLASIQRGYNILDPETQAAYLGSVFFLVRPFPNPTDAGRHIRAINRWCFETVLRGTNYLPPDLGISSKDAIKQLRASAYQQWTNRLRSAAMGAEGMHSEFWKELLWDQMVALVQVLGRATRGNVPLRVHFCDAAFYPDGASRSLLEGWVKILDDYLSLDSDRPLVEQQLAKILYGAVHDRLTDLLGQL